MKDLTCKDCKHWQEDENVELLHGADKGDYRTCTRLSNADREPITNSVENPAYIYTYLGFYDALRTSTDFGCNLFEAK